MFKEPDEPSMFDEIQTVVFANPDKIGKVYGVLGETMRLCLICDEAFTPQGAAEHAERVCYPKLRQEQACKARIMRTRQL
jgi:hypothetical protein